VAILDVHGEIVKLRSSRSFSFNKILKFVSEQCTPLVIASDVSPAPRLLIRVAAAFSVQVHKPAEGFSRRSKSRLVDEFELSERDRHKKDALAAAVIAYESKRPMLKRIEKILADEGLSARIETGDVARKIISGECNNIRSAIKSLRNEKEEDAGEME
jgi:predicted RNase H-like nuclease (RuvC/YqgF family)